MPPLGPPKEPETWREAIEADLQADVDAGRTLYGKRPDGAYIARTRDGDRVVDPGEAYRELMAERLQKSA